MLQAYGLFHYSTDDFQHTLIGVLVTRNSRMWLQFIDQDCFPSDIPLRLAEKISGACYSALYFVPLPVPSTVIYPFCTSLFRIVTVFDLPNPVASTMAELGISLFFSS